MDKSLPRTMPKPSSQLVAISSCIVYSFCSCSMILTNKALASNFNPNMEVLLVAFQNITAVALVESFRRFRIVSYAPFQKKVALQWLPVNLFFVSMLFTGFMSLKYMSVPMVTIFKNLTNILIAFGEWYWFHETLTPLVTLSFTIMLIGAIMASWSDLAFSFLGYFWMSANCLTTGAYVLYMKKATKSIELSKFGMVFYNNLLSLPLLFVLALLKGEFSVAVQKKDLFFDTTFFFLNLFAGAVGFLLNLASLWCVGATSATTYAIVGSINKIPVSLLGYLLFATPIGFGQAIFISISMLGGFLYSYAKL